MKFYLLLFSLLVNLSALKCGKAVFCQYCRFNSTQGCASCNDTRILLQYFNTSHCICKQGYYQQSYDFPGQCKMCNQHCATCWGADIFQCITCKQGHQFIKSSSKNDSSTQNYFQDFDYGQCRCPTGQYSVYNNLTNNFVCNNCLTGCASCQNGTFCTKCSSNYYLSSFYNCKQCHSTCKTCDGQRNIDCLSCQQNKNRSFDQNRCRCKTGYFQSGTGTNRDTCLRCNDNCQTCQNNDNHCTSCNVTLHLILNNYKCQCDKGFYQQSNVCKQCATSCIVCNGNPTNCTSCINKFYYSSLNNQCLKCHYTCQICINGSANGCVTCSSQTDTFRCFDRYIDYGYLQKCVNCNSSCLTCQTTMFNCTSCIQGYYLNSSSCVKCIENCLKCKNQTSCQQCNLMNNFILQDQKCVCSPNFYQDFVNNQCNRCNQKCSTCFGPNDTQCITCNRQLHFIQKRSQCLCDIKYYLINNVCLQCHQSCAQCQGSSESQCTACVAGQYLNSSNYCVDCNYQCQECVQSSNNCTKCLFGSFRYLQQNKCKCQTRYFDNGTANCSKCSDRCLICSNETNCNQCQDGYFVDNNGTCKKCSYRCQLCSVLQNNCTKCPYNSYRLYIPDCSCPAQFYDQNQTVCVLCQQKILNCVKCDTLATTTTCLICITGYYYNDTESKCKQCHKSCYTCSAQNETNCTSCNPERFRNVSCNPMPCTGKCQCFQKYFENQTTGVCTRCHQSCKTCNGSTNMDCIDCPLDAYRINNTSTNTTECPCQNGYFDDGQQKCVICYKDCLTCVDQSTNCTSCNPSSLYNNTCVDKCPQGFYSQNYLCKACSQACISCFNDLQCTECESAFKLFNSRCIRLCPVRYENGERECKQCHPWQYYYKGDCSDKCSEGLQPLDVDLNCFPSENQRTFNLSYFGFYQQGLSLHIFLYSFYNLSDVFILSNQTMQLKGKFIDDDIDYSRILQSNNNQLGQSLINISDVKNVSRGFIKVQAQLQKGLHYKNVEMTLFFKEPWIIRNSQNKIITHNSIKFNLPSVSFNPDQIYLSRQNLSIISRVISICLIIILIFMIILMKIKLIRYVLRFAQIIYLYSFIENVSLQTRLFCYGFGWANFTFLFNPFIYLIPQNYFQRSSHGFSLSIRHPNFFQYAGSSIFYLLLVSIIMIIMIGVNYVVKFRDTTKKGLKKIFSNLYSLAFVNISFFGLAQLKSYFQNKDYSDYPNLLFSSTIIGIILTLIFLSYRIYKFIIKILLSKTYDIHPPDQNEIEYRQDYIIDPEQRITGKQIKTIISRVFYYLYQFFVICFVVFYSKKGVWLFLLVLEMTIILAIMILKYNRSWFSFRERKLIELIVFFAGNLMIIVVCAIEFQVQETIICVILLSIYFVVRILSYLYSLYLTMAEIKLYPFTDNQFEKQSFQQKKKMSIPDCETDNNIK